MAVSNDMPSFLNFVLEFRILDLFGAGVRSLRCCYYFNSAFTATWKWLVSSSRRPVLLHNEVSRICERSFVKLS